MYKHALTAFLCIIVWGCAPAEYQQAQLPVPDQRQPGLAATFYYGKFRHIASIATPFTSGRPGRPVLQINHQFGHGEVYDSGRSTAVGVHLDGWIHMERPGTYSFKALSNDGVRLLIGGEQILEDPNVHGDRWSPEGTFTASEGGWYPIKVIYFQRKGTAALALHWMPPGGGAYQVVPETAYIHAAADQAK